MEAKALLDHGSGMHKSVLEKKLRTLALAQVRGDMEQTAKEALNSESRVSQMCCSGQVL
jgi:hypothetical protein